MMPLASVWDERLRSTFGLSMLDHPARLQDGIRAACKELSLASDAELLARLEQNDANAKAALARSLTVGETYFFRESAQLDHFRAELLPAALARAPRPVVVVSAGCSTGEEAYTLAIIVREALGADANREVRVVGFDLNSKAIATARRGVYRPWSVRGMTEDVKRRWFDETAHGVSIKAAVRSLVTFEQRNLVDPRDALAPASADVVFCRNVLIYFDDESVTAALRQLDQALRPGGTLVVGAAEAAFFSIAKLGAHAVGETWIHERDEVAPASPRRPRPKPISQRRPRPAPRRAAVEPAPAPAPAPPAPEARHDVDEVLARGWKALASDPVAAGEEARRAILLDRTLAAAHVLAASAALALRELPAARASLRHARRALATVKPEATVRGADGATADQLHAYCARLERALGAKP